MFGKLNDITISGIYSVVPSKYIKNCDCTEILSERELKKQIRVTGIECRHVVSQQQTSADLCTLAAERLIEKLKWEKREIRVLIYVTQTPDLERPSTAFLIQRRLKLSKECLVFDINLGCSGYVGGLISVSSILQTCGGKGLLLVGDGDANLQREGRGENLLMGDAGTATAIQVDKKAMQIPYSMYSDGSGYQVLMKEKEKSVKMNAAAVFSFAINEVPDCLQKFMENNGIQDEDVDYYVFHQAQKFILDNIAEMCDLPKGKVLFSLKDYGNTVGASIPLTICNSRDFFVQENRIRVILCGFGIGLSWGCIYAEINTDTIFEIEETEYFYSDRS